MKKLILLLLLVPTLAFSADWYVDSDNDGGTENGTSWATAWGKLADISWAGMSNGDTLYISGGTVSKTYAERMTVGHSYVTIKPGQASPHNGQVIFSPAQGTTGTINIASKDNVVISGSGGIGTYGIKVVGDVASATCCQGSIYVSGSSANTIIEYTEITATSMIDGGGIRFDWLTTNQAGSEIRYNWIHDCDQDGLDLSVSQAKATGYGTGVKVHHNIIENVKDDHIESIIGGMDIYNNIFRNRIDPSRGHPDGHQLYNSYYRIYNNAYSGFMNASGGNSIIYWEPDGGENFDTNDHQPTGFMVYNNTFHEDNTASLSMTGIQLGLSDSRFTSMSDLYVANNTFIGRVAGAAWVQSFGGTKLCAELITNMYVVNNVFDNSSSMAWSISPGPNPCSLGSGTEATYGSWGDNNSWTIDYNLYANNGSNQINWTTYSTWIASTGTQDNGTSSSSNIPTTNFIPPSDSPAVGAGVDLSSLMSFTTDKAGVSRGSTWDIGAYQYEAGADTTPSAFSFTDQTGVALGSTNNSDNVTVAGIDNTTTLALTGDASCKYSINGAAWATADDNVTLNDNVALQNVASGSYSTAISCTLNLGGVTDTWSRTTLAAVSDPVAPRFKGASMSGGWR